MSQTAEDIIHKLGLQPHPEGGFFRETLRDPAVSGGRSASTAIFFLLREGELSRWHRVDAAEVWHFYKGAPLELSIAEPTGKPEKLILGNDLTTGQLPQHVVPTGHWQQARSLGEWTLVGCTVAPGFEFSGFEMAPPQWEPGSVD